MLSLKKKLAGTAGAAVIVAGTLLLAPGLAAAEGDAAKGKEIACSHI